MASAKALTKRRVEQLISKNKGVIGWHKDAQTKGLLLQITRKAEINRPAAANWVLRYTFGGRERYFGMGSLSTFNLEEARARARKVHQQIAEGTDPVKKREDDRAAAILAKAKTITFEKATTEYFNANQSQWKSAVHRAQFMSTLKTYAFPTLGKLAVADIDTPLVLRVLRPIWESKTETASRVRQRIEAVLAWATVNHYRTGDNPARWKNLLDKALPKPTKVTKVVHHPSLDYREAPAFMRKLRQRQGFAAAALQLTVLCATRTSETILATWDEFDLDEGIWTIPPERMKAGNMHQIGLSDQAVALLRSLPREGNYVFCGTRPKMPLSNMAMSQLLARMGFDHVTTHGFRSSFHTWASDTTKVAEDVIEAALAHVIPSGTKKAYKRTTQYDKRTILLQRWADYLS